MGKDFLFKSTLGHCVNGVKFDNILAFKRTCIARIERKQERERQMNDCGYVNDVYYSPVAAKIPICQL